MKAVSTVIVIILILMISVALSALSYMFFSKIFTSVTTSGKEAIGQATSSLTALMKIEAVSNTNVSVRNIGNKPLTGFAVFIDDKPIKFSIYPTILNSGQVANIKLYYTCSDLKGKLKVTTAEGTLAQNDIDLASKDPDLVLCLSFDEDSSTTATDSSNYGNNGILQNFAFPSTPVSGWTTNCKSGSCLRFDGTNDIVTISSPNNMNPTNNITLETWINIPLYPGASQGLFYQIMIGDAKRFLITDTGKVLWQVNTLNLVTDVSVVPLNLWKHIAVISNSTGRYIYIDGIINKTDNIGWSLVTDAPMKIGSFGGATYATNGTIDEVRMYKRSLTPEEIYNHYFTLA